jgi:hypothetical protein
MALLKLVHSISNSLAKVDPKHFFVEVCSVENIDPNSIAFGTIFLEKLALFTTCFYRWSH